MEEEDLISRREAYLNLASEGLSDTRSRRVTFTYSLARLGTLTDVRNCLDDMAAKGQYQFWPRLRRFHAEAVVAWEWNLIVDAVRK
ncbi:hypothetical protein BGZ74_003157, partial [Mortierella antarctica]